LKGGYGFFLNKYSDSQCRWKKYSDFGGGKKKYWIPRLHRNPYRERYITSPSTEALLRPSG
jgi:hypothetical protein